MAQYNKVIEGTFTSTGVNKFLSFPVVPNTIEIWNKTKYNTTSNNTGVYALGLAEDADAKAYVTASNGTTWLGKTITAGGFTFLSAGTPAFGAVQAMATTFVTQASAANITVTGHGYNTGDVVWVYGTTGMLQIAGLPYTITKVDANNFTIPVNSAGFAAAATAGSVKLLKFADLYLPELCYITAVSTGTTTTITTNINHNMVVGQEVLFKVPSGWGMTQLDGLTGYVNSVTAGQFVVSINSTGFTAFAYPTSAAASVGITFPHVVAIGDQNSGFSAGAGGVPPFLGVSNGVIGIPGSFVANTRQGVIVGTGDGTTIVHANNDVIRFRAVMPDLNLLNQ